MKNLAYIAFVFAFYFNFGCANTQEFTTQKSVYTFSHNQQPYEIVSLNTSSGEGTNIITELTDRSNNNIGRDINQDGTLDVVVRGTLSLEELDVIYKAGIESAQNSGNYKERVPLRRYVWNHEQYTLILTTYFVTEVDVNNVFYIMLNADNTDHIYTDRFSNGELDSREKGYIEIERAQQLYEMTLLKGLDEHRVTFNDTTYIVSERRTHISFEKNNPPNSPE